MLDGMAQVYPVLVPIRAATPTGLRRAAKSYRRTWALRPVASLVYLVGEALDEYDASFRATRIGALTLLGEPVGVMVAGVESDHQRVAMFDSYTNGDHVIYLWEKASQGANCMASLGKRIPGQRRAQLDCQYPLPRHKNGLFFITSLFADGYGLGYLGFEDRSVVVNRRAGTQGLSRWKPQTPERRALPAGLLLMAVPGFMKKIR
jgi:hypothetical protein